MRRQPVADRVRPHTHARTVALACAAAIVAWLGQARSAGAADWQRSTVRVVWREQSHVYVAADSGRLSPGMPLSLRRGRRELATATVERLLDARLALARLRSGSLEHESRVDRLEVWAGDPPLARSGSLRVGLPAPSRTTLLFACRSPHWNAPAAGAYSADTTAHGVVRLVRAATTGPETLVVRFFPDAADEEIALERGELDVALFWPGEPSSRARHDARWAPPLLVRRARGVLACSGPDSLAPDPASLARLERDVFAGDLDPIPLAPRPGAPAPRLAGLEPDPAMPGATGIARALAGSGPRAPRLRLEWIEDAPGAVAPARPLFAVRAVLLMPATHRAGWPAGDGASELAELLQCGGPR